MRNTKDRRAAIILALGTVRIAQDHSEDPEKRHDPGSEHQGYAEDGREEKNSDQAAGGVIAGRVLGRRRGLVVDPLGGGGAIPVRLGDAHTDETFMDVQSGREHGTEAGAESGRLGDQRTETEWGSEEDEENSADGVDACCDGEDGDGDGEAELIVLVYVDRGKGEGWKYQHQKRIFTTAAVRGTLVVVESLLMHTRHAMRVAVFVRHV